MKKTSLGFIALVGLGCGDEPPPAPGPLCAGAEVKDLEALHAQFEDDVYPLFARTATAGGCVDCHNPAASRPVVIWADADKTMDELWAGGYLSAAGEERTLLGVLRPEAALRMPQGGAAWSTDDVMVVESFVCAVHASGLEPPVLCEGEPDAGNNLVRRLSNDEYDRTVGDATGDVSHPAQQFPSDVPAHGFDNVASAQQFSTTHLERYADAGRQLAVDTLLVPAAIDLDFQGNELSSFNYWGSQLAGTPGWGGPVDDPPGYFHFEHMAGYVTTGLQLFPYDGTYTIVVRARGKNANYVYSGATLYTDLPPEMRVTVGGATFGAVVAVPGPGLAWGPWAEYIFTGPLGQGTHTVRVGLDNVAWGDPIQFPVELDVDWIEVSGPLRSELPEPDAERIARFLVCDEGEAGCAETVVENALTTLWRRPAAGDEIARYVELIGEAQAQGDSFKDGVELVIEAALVSPMFLFRPEIDPEPDVLESRPVEPYALASRLSYFLWSGPPDAELLSHAAAGTLGEEDVLAAQVDRMLEHPKAVALSESFAAQWLQLRQMEQMTPSTQVFPEFDEELREAMMGEVRALFTSFLAEDLSLLEIVDTDFTYVNERLAAHYGMNFSGGAELERVDVAGEARGGLIESAGFLTLTSHPTKTSPTRRGKWILDQLLCQPPADPPPDVPTTVEPPPDGDASLKEMLERHREDPVCASCHLEMDSMGLTLEHFDPLGRWRELDDFDMPVDPSSELPNGVPLEDHRAMVAYIQNNPAFESCVTKKMLIYALGRDPQLIDGCALDAVIADFAASGHTVRGLVRAIVMSPLFRQRRPEVAGEYDYLNASEEN